MQSEQRRIQIGGNMASYQYGKFRQKWIRECWQLIILATIELSAATAAAAAATKGTPMASARIVGGTADTISALPYLVSLRKGNNFICGGSLVTTRHVVTAAHCVKGYRRSSLTVVAGATRLTDNGYRSSVAKAFVPKSYNGNNFHMDVAVLRLSSALSGANVATIPLCNASWKVGDIVQISGWGLTSERTAAEPNQVRTVKVPLISKATCGQQYQTVAKLTRTMFCAGVPGSKDACSGDSGGPVVYKGQLCGIVSWGVGCGRRSFPGVYTSVKTVRAYIDSAIRA